MRDVGRAAESRIFGLEVHDRHRRLGRNPRDMANDESVDHDVADDQHAASAEPGHEIAGAPRVQRRQRHACASASVGRAAANGTVTSTRKSIRNSESPKLYSKSPAASIDA